MLRSSWRCAAFLAIVALPLYSCSLQPTQRPTPRPSLTATSTSSASPEVESSRSNQVIPTATPFAADPTATALPTQEPTKGLDIEPSDLDGTAINFWHIWSGQAGQVIQALVDEFNQHNEWGISVQPVYQGNLDQLDSNLQGSFTKGEVPELTIGLPHQALAWNLAHDLAWLDDYVNDPQWGIAPEEQQDYYTAFWQADLFDGNRFGIPYQRSGHYLYYNQSWAKELGFGTPPLTPEAFKEQACAAAQANLQDADPDNNRSGGWIISNHYAAILGWIYAFGGQITNPGQVDPDQDAYAFDTQAVEQAIRFLRELYDSGCAWLVDPYDGQEEFANRRGLFASGSVMQIADQFYAFQKTGNTDQWTLIPFPSPGEQATGVDVYGPSLVMFQSNPERQLAAWLFIKWLSVPQNIARLVEATGSLPVRSASLDYLQAYQSEHSQWAAALKILPFSRSEPALVSWSDVRWAVSDAATQLFRSYFTIDQAPELVEFLDQTAADLHAGRYLPGRLITPDGRTTPTLTTTSSTLKAITTQQAVSTPSPFPTPTP